MTSNDIELKVISVSTIQRGSRIYPLSLNQDNLIRYSVYDNALDEPLSTMTMINHFVEFKTEINYSSISKSSIVFINLLKIPSDSYKVNIHDDNVCHNRGLYIQLSENSQMLNRRSKLDILCCLSVTDEVEDITNDVLKILNDIRSLKK